MGVVHKEKKGGVMIYHVSREVSVENEGALMNTNVKPSQISLIVTDDADVYTEDERLLMRFRKGVLPKRDLDLFYDNVIKFAMRPTSNRGSTSGKKGEKTLKDNPRIMTNILGYFDIMGPRQKWMLTQLGKTLKLNVRETYFTQKEPEKYKQCLPLIKDIDRLYEKYVPGPYALQRKKANQTPFRIPGTAFTTITTNVNFQTTIHKDKGDDVEGFGNLTVIERDGHYTGGETCLVAYGVGADVRTGDILFMNVHEIHGNLPIHYTSKDAKRLSVVAYLRERIWQKTKGMSRVAMQRHLATMRKTLESGQIKNKTRRRLNH
jgi:hypothetical protein